jgi:hypothetical protein
MSEKIGTKQERKRSEKKCDKNPNEKMRKVDQMLS